LDYETFVQALEKIDENYSVGWELRNDQGELETLRIHIYNIPMLR